MTSFTLIGQQLSAFQPLVKSYIVHILVWPCDHMHAMRSGMATVIAAVDAAPHCVHQNTLLCALQIIPVFLALFFSRGVTDWPDARPPPPRYRK